MVDKIKRIFEIYELSESPKEIVIFMQNFKVRGKLFTDKTKMKEDLITLTDAVVCNHFDKCQCEETAKYYEWINIYDKEILAFSVI